MPITRTRTAATTKQQGEMDRHGPHEDRIPNAENGKMRRCKEASQTGKLGRRKEPTTTPNYRSAGQEPAQILAMMPKREMIPRSQERDFYSGHENRRVTLDH